MPITPTKPLILDKRNPFKRDVQDMLAGRLGTTTRTVETDADNVTRDRITITLERERLRMPYIKLFQHKEVLEGLDPWSCKILVYIALNAGYQEQRIKMNPTLVGIDKRRFSKSLLNLVSRRVIEKEKREWYWINVSLLVVGNLDHKQG